MTITARFSTIRTIECSKGFYIDIVYDSKQELFYAWLFHEDYGVKESMFGCPVEQPNGITTIEYFTELAIANAPDYITSYEEDYMS